VRVLDEPHLFVDIASGEDGTADAVEALQEAFGFSEVQAAAALGMQFRRLGKTSQLWMRSELSEMRP
jgi:DNA gyrase/topoisomerase IV subunit A